MSHFIVKRNISQKLAETFMQKVTKGKLNTRTFKKDGTGKLVGLVSEALMDSILRTILSDSDIELTADKSFDYDFLVDGCRVDIKAKQRTVPVNPDHDVSIAAYTIDQQMCQTYMFCSITVDRETKSIPREFYFTGFMDKSEYLKTAQFKKKGETDGGNFTDGSEFRIRADCWNLKYKQLQQFDYETLEPLLKKGYELIEWKP